MANTKTDVTFVRNRKYGTVSVAQNGWTKEVCNVTWNGRNPKLDIREWDTNYNRMSKGITFSKDEARKLLKILAGVDFEGFDDFCKQSGATTESIPESGNNAEIISDNKLEERIEAEFGAETDCKEKTDEEAEAEVCSAEDEK